MDLQQASKEGTESVNVIWDGKYLTFSLGQEDYGIGILKVKEIIGMMPITAMPRTPD
jgi:chemotaxis signal transduction protein